MTEEIHQRRQPHHDCSFTIRTHIAYIISRALTKSLVIIKSHIQVSLVVHLQVFMLHTIYLKSGKYLFSHCLSVYLMEDYERKKNTKKKEIKALIEKQFYSFL